MPKRNNYDECPYDGDHACAVEAFLDALGGRWKGMILYHLLPGTRRFGELRKLLPHVTQRMLTNQLRELERDGIVTRKVYAQVPPKVEYALTPIGQKLNPILLQMATWGDTYMRALESTKPQKSPPPRPTPK
jgi:DNA-binding HxlR family transcriptional regulator